MLSKALGIAIIAGSVTLKLPQIINILKAKSAAGVSGVSVYLENFAMGFGLVYGLSQGLPFSTFGETAFIFVQNALLILTIAGFNGGFSGLIKWMVALGIHLAGLWALYTGLFPSEYIAMGYASGVPLVITARLPQIWESFKNGHTGQLSFLTVFMQVGGNAARTFTTIQEAGGDMLMVTGYLIGLGIASIMLGQILYYWKATNEFNAKAAKAKKA